MQKCWICNINDANSGEHKIKASEIRKLMRSNKFDGFYKSGDNEPVTINTSKHKTLKFPKIICDDCNNYKTAQADNSYNDFVSYIGDNYESLVSTRKIDFKEIYGNNWRKRKIDLYRYLAKHAGCKTFSGQGDKNIDLSELSSFIQGKELIRNFYVFFQLNSVIGLFTLMTVNTDIENFKPILANGATIYFGFNNNSIWSGSIIHSFLKIHWIITDKIYSIKHIDFDNAYENLEILDFDFYPTPFTSMRNNMESIEYLIFGKFNEENRNELREYYKEKFEEIYEET